MICLNTIKYREFYNYEIKTPPSNLPITVDEVKTHLKINGTSEDAYLTSLIKAISKFFENFTNRTLINTTYTAYLDCFPNSLLYNTYCCNLKDDNSILIKKSKLSLINSIKYYLDNVLTVWDSSNYYFTKNNLYSYLFLTEDGDFPSDVDDRRQAVEIEFVAGYGDDSDSIPDDIKIAFLNHISYLYENRGDCPLTTISTRTTGTCAIPYISRVVYNQYKIPNLIGAVC